MIATVGGEDVAGKVLKSKSGWKSDGNGTDAYGFSALPAGRSDVLFAYPGHFTYCSAGKFAYFWSATKYDSGYDDVYYMRLSYYDDASLRDNNKYVRLSVRCLRDSRL